MKKRLTPVLAMGFAVLLSITSYAKAYHYENCRLGVPGAPGEVVSGDMDYKEKGKDYATFSIEGEPVKNSWVLIPFTRTENWYYFDENGKTLEEGWHQKENGSYFYIFGDGSMATGWRRLDGNYYYFDPATGNMWTSGTAERDGAVYEFTSDGLSHKVTGLKQAEENGTEGWEKSDGRWYYLKDGQRVLNQWLADGDSWYYVGADGAMYTGYHFIGDLLYSFRTDGIMERSCVVYYQGQKYTMDDEGRGRLTGMTTEELLNYSNTAVWCRLTYEIYTVSQKQEEAYDHASPTELPAAEELLKRDWGIATKKQCLNSVQKLYDSANSRTDKAGKAWDFSRAMALYSLMNSCGWCTEQEMLEGQLAMAPAIQASFSSWDDFFDSYMEGCREWAAAASFGSTELQESAYTQVKGNTWNRVDWNAELKKTW